MNVLSTYNTVLRKNKLIDKELKCNRLSAIKEVCIKYQRLTNYEALNFVWGEVRGVRMVTKGRECLRKPLGE